MFLLGWFGEGEAQGKRRHLLEEASVVSVALAIPAALIVVPVAAELKHGINWTFMAEYSYRNLLSRSA
jgi:hypothetical protein